MYRLLFFLLIILLCKQKADAQLEAAQWRFGFYQGLSFQNSTVTSVNNSSITANEGCSSFSDVNGNIVLYTNGQSIWNSNNAQVPGLLMGNPSSAQSSLVFHKSGSQYYVFTTGAFGNGPAAYTIYDAAAANNTGSVVSTTILQDSVTERMAATLNCSGTGTWVVVHKQGNQKFYSFLATANSIANNPVISSAGATLNYPMSFYGVFAFSPEGDRLLCARSESTNTSNGMLEMFNFDRSTGSVSSPTLLVNSPGYLCVGATFSPDGSKVYTCLTKTNNQLMVPKYICQIDLCALTATNSTIPCTTLATVYSSPNQNSLLSGPLTSINGKVYFTSENVLGEIASPNTSGLACGTNTNVLSLNAGGFTFSNLPNFVSNVARQKASFSSSLDCARASLSVNISTCASINSSIIAVDWFYGDGGSILGQSAVMLANHTYSANGSYIVKMLAHFNCSTDTVLQVIQVTNLPTINISGRTTICSKESTTLSVLGAGSYSWSSTATGSAAVFSPTSTTVYTLSATDQSCTATKIFTVNVKTCTGISNQAQALQIGLYPNPSDESIHVLVQAESHLRVFSLCGKVVHDQFLLEGNTEVSLKGWPAGLYVFEVAARGQVYRERVAITR